jgi:hypothetical protein
VVVGQALQDGYRTKIRLATKMPSWFVNAYEDFDKLLKEQLGKLRTEHIDFYLLHGLNKNNWPKLRDLEVLKWAEKAIADGRIGHLGFSFHDDLETFKQIIDASSLWRFCQIQYNFMDIEYQAGTEGLKYAAQKGLAVVVMEPLRGGQLAKEPPDSLKAVWSKGSLSRSHVEWALQWVWNQPEVSVVLSGMTTMQQVQENIASAERSGVGRLSSQDLSLIEQVRAAYHNLSPIPCTGCGYCMPCPNGVDIPHAFRYYNDAMMYNDPRMARFRYREKPPEALGDHCLECGECEEKCPQQIPVAEWLKKVHDYLGPRKKN